MSGCGTLVGLPVYRLDGEALQLLAHCYTKCFYISLYCPHCGDIRTVTALAPEDEWCACPACKREHCNCSQIGVGYTRRALPVWEIWCGPVSEYSLHRMMIEAKPEPVKPLLKRGWRLTAV